MPLTAPITGFPGSTAGKESACQCRRRRGSDSTPGSGRSPGGGHGSALQCYGLENPTDRGAWRATVHGVLKSWTRLKLFEHACMPASITHPTLLFPLLQTRISYPVPSLGRPLRRLLHRDEGYLPSPSFTPDGLGAAYVTWEAPGGTWWQKSAHSWKVRLGFACDCPNDLDRGTSLVAQWLGLHAFNSGAQVQSLVGELRSHMPW